MTESRCPKCGEPLVLAALIPESQSLTVELTSESELLPALVIGDALKGMDAVLREVAKESGQPVAVLVRSIAVEPFKARIEFNIVAVVKSEPTV